LGERYLSSWLFNDIGVESDTLDLDYFSRRACRLRSCSENK